ncbi:endonuclease domain-containing protein [Dokdonia sinensis]|uniref:Endonuclease domain-containing protein n=1 Tax=Dokdonia sinensis TaxID=2479847 RepID=A0A3M0GFI2_9FLAO|nr:endonuclease domain-containing protein [Dokdonia sinensis]RMB63490.1 endonuclease domain-containing protein [Dokdonia sinensis]
MKFKDPKPHDPPETRDLRKHLRNNATPAEAFLWKHLSKRQLAGRKFRRQHGIGPFVVDFFCSSEKLIIELDGEPHTTLNGEERDEKRDEYLESKGFKVLRFENKMVFELMPSVLKDIVDNFRAEN